VKWLIKEFLKETVQAGAKGRIRAEVAARSSGKQAKARVELSFFIEL